MANRKARSPAPKTPSNNLVVVIVKILRKHRKGLSEMGSNHRAANRQNREEPTANCEEPQGVAGSPNPEDSQNQLPRAADLVETQIYPFHHQIRDGSLSTQFGAVHHRI
jgi:hypothetical protein